MRPWSWNPVQRILKRFEYEDADDTFVIETKQDVTSIIELNKAQYNQTEKATPWANMQNKVASIPMSIYAELVQKGIAQDDDALKAWLDDPSNRVWRVRPGRLSK